MNLIEILLVGVVGLTSYKMIAGGSGNKKTAKQESGSTVVYMKQQRARDNAIGRTGETKSKKGSAGIIPIIPIITKAQPKIKATVQVIAPEDNGFYDGGISSDYWAGNGGANPTGTGTGVSQSSSKKSSGGVSIIDNGTYEPESAGYLNEVEAGDKVASSEPSTASTITPITGDTLEAQSEPEALWNEVSSWW